MDLWLEAEVRMRRADALRTAASGRLTRLAESGRSTSIRTRLADRIDAISGALAVWARTLRAEDTAS